MGVEQYSNVRSYQIRKMKSKLSMHTDKTDPLSRSIVDLFIWTRKTQIVSLETSLSINSSVKKGFFELSLHRGGIELNRFGNIQETSIVFVGFFVVFASYFVNFAKLFKIVNNSVSGFTFKHRVCG